MTPTYVDPFLGAGAVWLALFNPGLVPPVSWMGGKRRMARELLQLLELVPGRPVACVVGDASWWGWVWQVVLDPDRGPAVSAWLRSWREEDPRALWFRLRDAGPAEDLVERAAGLLWLQARAASGVPVWWEGGKWEGNGYNFGQRVRDERKASEREAVKASQIGLVQWASTKIDGAGQRQATEPTLRAGARGDRPALDYEASARADNASGGNGIIDPGTIADRLDAIRRASTSTTILHADARTLTEEWAPRLGAAGRWYFDPPYQGATGYPVTCSRDEVLAIVELPARHGGKVVVSEAVGLAAELGRGWSQAQLRRGKKQEWVTVYGCDVRAALPPILRLAAGGA